MSMAIEERRIKHLFDHIETVEDVAGTLDPTDDRRQRLLAGAQGVLAEVDPVRPRTAARLLGLSEKTIRSWVAEGVLTPAPGQSRRLLLDPVQLHEVIHLVRDLRAAGRNRHLLEAVWHRLTDQALLERTDLTESLAQMQRGQGKLLYRPPAAG